MKKAFIFFAVLFIFAGVSNAQVSINNDGAAPDPSAMLEVKSSTKGILFPRITLANRPATPPAGLTIYQIDNGAGLYYYDGSTWQKMSLAAYDFWNPSGADIYFSSGRVGIGISNPDNFGLNVVNFISGKAAVKGTAQIAQSVYSAGYLGFANPSVLNLPLSVNYTGVLGVKPATGSNGAAVYGWNNDVNATNYGGVFYADGTGSQATNYGLYSVAKGGQNNYAGFYNGRVSIAVFSIKIILASISFFPGHPSSYVFFCLFAILILSIF